MLLQNHPDLRVMTDSPSHEIAELKKGRSLFETSPVLNEFAINTVIILFCMLIY